MTISVTMLHLWGCKVDLKPRSEKHQQKRLRPPVADPGFPRGGGANSPGGRQHDFAKFLQELHEIERIWPPPLDPPLTSP